MYFISDNLRAHPEIALFLTLALGYLIGKFKIGTFSLGAVVSTLLAGIGISIWINAMGGPVEVSHLLQTFFFSIFIFAVGFKVGPQFIQGLKGDGIKEAILAVIFCLTALGLTYTSALIFSFDKGLAAGFLAGCFTQSSAVGSATDAINALSISLQEKEMLINNITVSFALTFIFGTAGIPIWLVKVMPKLLGRNLKEECQKKEEEMSIDPEEQSWIFSAWTPATVRAIKIENDKFFNKKIEELESFFKDSVLVERVRKKSGVLDATKDLTLAEGDVLAIAGYRENILALQELIGKEVDDKELLDIPLEELDVVVTNKKIQGKTLSELARQHKRGIRLKRITRSGHELPFTSQTVIHKGDTLTIIGFKKYVDEVASIIGFIEYPSDQTDMTYIGLGLTMGALIGIPAIILGGISVSLSSSVGILILGVFLGWLRASNPKFGNFPKPAQWIFESVGLSAFMAIVGLNSGPQFIQGLLDKGAVVLLAGVVVSIIPHVVCMFLGQYLFGLNLGINMGVVAGADTATPALSAIEEESGSKIPSLGFTVPYAVGNILLTIWGPVLVAILP